MARPKKENADYFPHDVDMRNDLKVRALREDFGLKGYALWCMMLEHLGDCNYFEYKWSKLNIKLLAADFGITQEEIIEFVECCVELELLQIENNYLTCDKFSERLTPELSKKREGFSMENSKRKSLVTVNSTEMEFTESKPHGNTQSKVKESKLNQNKVNKSEVEENTLYETKVKYSEEEQSIDELLAELDSIQ